MIRTHTLALGLGESCCHQAYAYWTLRRSFDQAEALERRSSFEISLIFLRPSEALVHLTISGARLHPWGTGFTVSGCIWSLSR